LVRHEENNPCDKNRIGINPRPAVQFSKLMAGFSGAIRFCRGDDRCNGKEAYEALNLQVRMNETITVEAVGIDEEAAIIAAEDFLKRHL
jgi:phosphotransferase system HPr (HPr) family protein